MSAGVFHEYDDDDDDDDDVSVDDDEDDIGLSGKRHSGPGNGESYDRNDDF